MSVFDNKLFNGEVFKGYIDRIPNPNRTELIKSRAIRPRPDLASAMADQDGGNYMTTTLKGLINNSEPQNYDGSTDIKPSSTVTFKHSRVVVGRANAWTENDFSYDITGGQDFIENIAEQIAEYWNEIDQATIVHILKGVFAMTDVEGLKFVEAHTTDVTKNAATADVGAGCMSGTTLNSAIQKACGDGKGKFSLAIMHSVVATNL
ncbi:MAG: phage coat protein, partial [Eubacterium sp.]